MTVRGGGGQRLRSAFFDDSPKKNFHFLTETERPYKPCLGSEPSTSFSLCLGNTKLSRSAVGGGGGDRAKCPVIKPKKWKKKKNIFIGTKCKIRFMRLSSYLTPKIRGRRIIANVNSSLLFSELFQNLHTCPQCRCQVGED